MHKFYLYILTSLSKLTLRSSSTACSIDAWWNFLWTPRCFSRSFRVRILSNRPSSSCLVTASRYCSNPQSPIQRWANHVWSMVAALGYLLQNETKKWNETNGGLNHCKAMLGRGYPGIMRWILFWIMPLLQDWSLDLLTSSPAQYHWAKDAPLAATPGNSSPHPTFPS